MRSISKWLVSVAALAALAGSAAPAAAQFYGDDGPSPFRRGPGWDGPPRWDRWHHHRGWRDDDGDRRGWRDGRRGDRDRFGDDGGRGGRDRFRADDARRGPGDDGPRRGGPRPFRSEDD